LESAYILINSEIGAEPELIKNLKTIPEVTDAKSVYGVYNIIARVDSDTVKQLKDTISFKVNRLKTVRSLLLLKIIGSKN
jgi:DNA-binding Lrp family transcriptional regulator